MTLIYDEDIFCKFKDLSIRSVDELSIGETVYTNFDPDKPMTITALLTQFESNVLHGFVTDENDDNVEPRWLAYGPSEWDKISLNDYNVLSSYNPWMLFKTQELARQCAEELVVSYINDDPWDDYTDYAYPDFDSDDEDV